MKIFLLLAHPDKASFNGQLADVYEKSAIAKGHQVVRQNLGEMRFDPILHLGYAKIQELEPDLVTAWDNITRCDHWVIIYPVWWGNVPALFKGFLDRVMLPGKAFKYHQNDPWWDKLLKGRSAQLITTSDGPSVFLWLKYRNSDLNALKQATLWFCGFKPVTHHRIDRLKDRNEEARRKILDKVPQWVPANKA